ncbi:hypothetical protein N7G274_010318 [Stereocaulon virgatum]|uniref:PH domain-like protein n=1 Tax=Stereocaulon virgatum TaxID=373712 RepID=A0ABR3ZUR9_9LECA
MTAFFPDNVHHTYQPSDSDAPGATYDFFTPNPPNYNNTLPTPQSSTRTDAQLNLSVLQRHLPTTQSILRIAPFAVVYLFDPERKGWEKSGVEGSLFILQTYNENREGYAVFVLNRRALENYTLHLEKADQVEVTEEYIILQDGATVHGLWIFEEPEESTQGIRAEIGQAILECAQRAELINQDHSFSNGNGNGTGAYIPQEEPPARSPDLMALLGQPRPQAPQPKPQPQTKQGQNLLDLFRSDEQRGPRPGAPAQQAQVSNGPGLIDISREQPAPVKQGPATRQDLLNILRGEHAPAAQGADKDHTQNLLSLFRKAGPNNNT